jgi:hypothetical protein
MAEHHVIFKTREIAPDDWEVVAHCPGALILCVPGFKSQADADTWLAGENSTAWLRARGYLK